MAHLSRTLRRALALAVLTAAAVPTLAHATVKESTITSPAKPTYRLQEPEPTLADETLTVVARTDGAAKDKVDVICTFGDDYSQSPRVSSSRPAAGSTPRSLSTASRSISATCASSQRAIAGRTSRRSPAPSSR